MMQLSGSAFSASPPSFLLVNGNNGKDPIFEALTKLMAEQFSPVFRIKQPMERRPGDLNIFRGNPELSRQTMRAAVAIRKKLAAKFNDPERLLAELAPWPEQWLQCKAELFPAVEINHYRKAWDSDFGLVTGRDDYISLMIYGEKGRDALRKDLLRNRQKFEAPRGYNNRLEPVIKQMALVGTLPEMEWDGQLVRATLALQKPFFFLPHSLNDEIAMNQLAPLARVIFIFNRLHRNHPGGYFTDSSQEPTSEKFSSYDALVKRLSADLPGDREFLHRNLIRQLATVINRLAIVITPNNYGRLVMEALAADLYHTALRGIAYGLASLKYHARGLGVGNYLPAAVEALDYLRLSGRINRRQLQRKVYTLNSESRDHLLQRLEEAGLVVTEGRMVHAVHFSDFLKTIPSRERFPEHSLLTTCLL